MYTAIIIFMFFAILANCIAIVSIILCKQSQQKIVPDYTAAQHYIDTLDSKFNWDYLLDYLAVHLVKYESGTLPKLGMTLEAISYDVSYKITFNDTLNPVTVKYLKTAMQSLNENKRQTKITFPKNFYAQNQQPLFNFNYDNDNTDEYIYTVK